MKVKVLQLLATTFFLGLVGCATTPTTRIPAKPAPADTPSQTVAPEKSATPPKPEPVSSTAPLPQGEFAVLVESAPQGGMVVVNGIPIGKAPQRILLPGTNRGFFRDQVSLKVRFIVTDGAQASQTVEELLTPLDRIPATVRFTPNGATRVARLP